MFSQALCGPRARRASDRIACMLVDFNGGEDCSDKEEVSYGSCVLVSREEVSYGGEATQ